MIPKLDPDLEDLPRDLMQTEFHSLVVKVTLQNQKKENYTECNTNLKNTKCFRKVRITRINISSSPVGQEG